MDPAHLVPFAGDEGMNEDAAESVVDVKEPELDLICSESVSNASRALRGEAIKTMQCREHYGRAPCPLLGANFA